MTCYRVRWFTTLLSEHKLKKITCSSVTDASNVAITGHVLNERGTGTTFDRKSSWDRLKVLQKKNKKKKTWSTAPIYLLSVPLQVILTDEYISGAFGSLGISCISESVIVVWNSTCSAPCWLTFMLFGLKRTQEALRSYLVFHSLRARRIGHFRVPPGLCIKTSAQPLMWKWLFILMQIKLILTRKVLHLASFWKWGFLELGSGLLTYTRRSPRAGPKVNYSF